ncbi:MAG: glycosyltransferase family 4 protein [Pseudonocardia sp.]
MIDALDCATGAVAHWLVFAEEEFVPTDAGGRVESLNLLRAAAAAGVRLHVIVPGLSTSTDAAHQAALPTARLHGVPRRTGWGAHASVRPYVFKSRPLSSGLVQRLQATHAEDSYDAVVCISFRVAHLGEVVAEALDLPLLVRPHNIESEYFRVLARSVRPPRNLPYLAEGWKLRRAETAVHASSRVTLFADISAADAERRAELTSTPVVHVPPFLPPSSTTQTAVRRIGDVRTVLFLGSLDNGNNADGIRWFADNCWPVLHARCPRAKLHVVGRRAPANLRDSLERAGATVTVDAPEVDSHLAAADIFVNPVRHGAGINIKMVEAMAAGLAVVSTSVGARGLHWRAGEHLLVADEAAHFSATVASLLEDADERDRLAVAGRRFVERELDGVRQIMRLLDVLQAR